MFAAFSSSSRSTWQARGDAAERRTGTSNRSSGANRVRASEISMEFGIYSPKLHHKIDSTQQKNQKMLYPLNLYLKQLLKQSISCNLSHFPIAVVMGRQDLGRLYKVDGFVKTRVHGKATRTSEPGKMQFWGPHAGQTAFSCTHAQASLQGLLVAS